MTTRIPFSRVALAALCALAVVAVAPAAASAKTVRAELRVLTPERTLDAGTTYIVGPETVRTDPKADCTFGGAGGTGGSYRFKNPTALGLLQAASEARKQLRPLSITDESGFGLGICAIGPVDDAPGTFWYLKHNHAEMTVGADQQPLRNGDEFLIYLAADNFPAPNPAELDLTVPARARAGAEVEVEVVQHACTTDPKPPFETTCATTPAAGVTVSGGGAEATTGADGVAALPAGDGPRLRLSASRGADIPAEPATVCVSEELGECPPRHGVKLVGRAKRDRIKGTRGADRIRARGGRDRIDLRKGGPDRVNCGGGRDIVLLKRGDTDDRVARNCERIRRR